MDEPDGQGHRIDALEMRVMHQDLTIEELNLTITAQWRQIDLLTRRMAGLEDRLRERGSAPPFAPEPPPPHY